MANLCPQLGFVDLTDLSILGQPKVHQPTTVIALLHNLSPAGYDPQPGEVTFRWRPLGWTGDYCSLPLLSTASGSSNPAVAIDATTNNVMISPGGDLPATIVWVPGADVSGGLRGQVLCEAIALSDGQCPTVFPPDCSSMPYNLISARVNVQPAAQVSEPPPGLLTRANLPPQLHIGFVIANTFGIGVRIRIGVRSFSSHDFARDHVRIELGKAHFRTPIGRPAVFPQQFHTGLVPKRLFEDLVDRTQNAQSFGMESGEVRQGLLELNLPEKLEPSGALLEVTYHLIDDEKLARRTLGSFRYDLTEHSAPKNGAPRKDDGKSKK
jgi:hypothetical protein